MTAYRSSRQPDLFASAIEPGRAGRYYMDEPPPADFIARIRGELEVTLARARGAATMPWRDLTVATLAELRFDSIAGWLPPDEADALRAAFKIEMARLWMIASEQAEDS
jgi:hypothetical protein